MQDIIKKTAEFVKKELEEAEAGHDWWHIYRVWKLAKHIAREEEVDMLVVELAALLHDIADSKFHEEGKGAKIARDFLVSLKIDNDKIMHITDIVEYISFSKKKNLDSKEFKVVQDADRLDAIGAIGIARAFNYGGHKNRIFYDPELKPKLNMTREQYKNNKGTTINHFYEKLLLLKDRMNTETGKKMAEHRHRFMEKFLEEFYDEWEGKR